MLPVRLKVTVVGGYNVRYRFLNDRRKGRQRTGIETP